MRRREGRREEWADRSETKTKRNNVSPADAVTIAKTRCRQLFQRMTTLDQTILSSSR